MTAGAAGAAPDCLTASGPAARIMPAAEWDAEAQHAAVLAASIRDAGDAVSAAQGALSGLLTARDPGQGATVDESDLADEMDDIMRRLRHCARIAERRQAAGTEAGQ